MANKYGAKKVTIDGIKFDSKDESIYYLVNFYKQKEGISMEMQVPFILQDKFRRDIDGKLIREIKYIADFVFYDSTRTILKVVDVKGMILPEFRIKAKLFEARYGMPITIAKKIARKDAFEEHYL